MHAALAWKEAHPKRLAPLTHGIQGSTEDPRVLVEDEDVVAVADEQ